MTNSIVRSFRILLATLFLLGNVQAALAWTISGTIYGGSNPLPDASIGLVDAVSLASRGTTTTDANGLYSFAGLTDGTYNLTINSSSYGESVVNGITVSGANVVQNVVLVAQARILSGKVTTPGGLGVRNVVIQIYEQASGVLTGSQATDANGDYSIPVASGTYYTRLRGGYDLSYTECGGYCTSNIPIPQSYLWNYAGYNLIVGADTTQNFTLPLVSLSGKTTDGNGVPVGNVTISQEAQGSYYPAGGSTHDYYSSTNSNIASDASGNYSITLLADNTVSVTLVPPSGSGLAQTVISDLSILADTVRDFSLSSAILISGKVTTPGGVGISNVVVQIYEQASGVFTGMQATDANGDYSIPVASGTYYTRLKGGSDYHDSTACGGHCTSNVPIPKSYIWNYAGYNLIVTTDTTQNFTLPLVSLSGKTTDGNGVPVGNVTISQDAQGSYYPAGGSTNDYYSSTNSNIVSDASGNYSMTLLADNTVSVILVPPSGSGLAQTVISNISCLSDTVRDFSLSSALLISGKVTTSGGVGVRNVVVQIYDQASGVLAGTIATDASGDYSIPVASGTYYTRLRGGYDLSYTECGGYCTSNIPIPQSYLWNYAGYNLIVGADTTQNFTLPLVSLSGKTTDGNGVPVGNVTISQDAQGSYYPAGGSTNDYYSSTNSNIKSDASGNYSMTLLADNTISVTIIPPTGSGFAQTVVSSLNLMSSILQNIILAMPDSTPPIILSGPTVSAITDTSAVIAWQTNERTTGGLKYGLADPPTTTVNETGSVTGHSLVMGSLSANTTYYVKVFGSDLAGNGPVYSGVISFTTKPTPDFTAPTIVNGPIVSAIGHNTAVIEWSTSEPSTGHVNYGATALLGQSVNDGLLAINHKVTLSGLTHETVYYFQVDATDGALNGPTLSGLMNFNTLAVPDSAPPQIVEGPMVIDISKNGATIIWTTDEPATSGVSYNDGIAYGVFSDNNLVTEHSVHLENLSPSTLYNFTVSTKDALNNGPTLSGVGHFTTLATPDTNPPVITEYPVKHVNHQQAIIAWQTNEPASSVIEYGLAADQLTEIESHASLTVPHNMTLTGLESGTIYYFRIVSTDAAGNASTSQVWDFTTDAAPNNKKPVVTKAPQAVYAGDDTLTVTWETDEPTDTVIEYNAPGQAPMRRSKTDKETQHQVTIKGLIPDTGYEIAIAATDVDGNTTLAKLGYEQVLLAFMGDTGPFVPQTTGTTLVNPDIIAPVITAGPAVVGSSDTMVTIQWSTDEIADSLARYGLSGGALALQVGDIIDVSLHTVVLTNLTPNTTYDYTVESIDPSGNGPRVSTMFTFTTLAAADTTPPTFTDAPGASMISEIKIRPQRGRYWVKPIGQDLLPTL